MLRAAPASPLLLCLLVFANGCGDPAEGVDASTEDAGASTEDAGPSDAGRRSCSDPGACDDSLFCNGLEVCVGGACAAGDAPCSASERCDEDARRCEPAPPAAAGLPIGIPTPSFGWELDTTADPSIYVDNTDPDCDDAAGTAEAPLCDLFRGGRSVTYEAGDVVRILGGPYAVSGDYTLTANGTAEAPVVISAGGGERVLFDGGGERAEFAWEGAYGIVVGIDFFHMTRHRVAGDHLALRDVAVHNPPGAFIDFNPVVSVTGHDVLIHRSAIFDNRRTNDTDSHGIQASRGSHHVWILENELSNNNGDSFQGCHMCFDAPPHHVYLGRNVMHDDRENGIDLKTIHDVVISENLLYGYGSSATSNGDAMVIGSNGFDDALNLGPRRVWVLHNEIRDSATGIRIEGSEDVWLVGNVIHDVGVGVQIDDKPHRSIVLASNTLRTVTADGVSVFGCRPSTLALLGNLLVGIGERHLDMAGCDAPAVSIEHQLFGEATSVRVAGGPFGDVASLNAEAFATGNVEGAPLLDASFVPMSGSPAIDAGTSLAAVYAAFEAAYGIDIARDAAGTARPTGVAEDIGARERP